MKTKTLISRGLVSLCLAATLLSCSSTPNANKSPVASQPSPSTPVTEAAGKITEIAKQTVVVRQLNSAKEISAKQGMNLQLGETIRTQKDALAQVELNSGLAFRLGSNSAVTLQPNNQLKLLAGEMLTWVPPGKKLQAAIITPAGIAGVRGTTVYVQIPQNANEGIEFFSWEGTVNVQLPTQAEGIEIKTGEQVKIKVGEKDIGKISKRVRRFGLEEFRQRRRRATLLTKFNQPLPTLPIIDKIVPGQAEINTPTP